jgi:hypothetical protein
VNPGLNPGFGVLRFGLCRMILLSEKKGVNVSFDLFNSAEAEDPGGKIWENNMKIIQRTCKEGYSAGTNYSFRCTNY